MTVEQDVRNLQALNADLERRLQEITDLVYLWKVNGAQDLFAEAGGQIYGGGAMRLDGNGIQVKSDPSAAKPGLFFIAQDHELQSEPASDLPRVQIEGYATEDIAGAAAGQSYLNLWAYDDDGGYARVHVESYAFSDESFIQLLAKHANSNSFSEAPELVVYDVNAGERYVGVLKAPFRLASFTADPTTTLADGDLWYRSDTDEIRARINGSTVSLSTGGGAMKVQGDGYYVLPSTIGAGTSVTPGSGSFGSWAQVEASTSEAIYITHITLEDGNASGQTYYRIQIGTGAAASETAVSTVQFGESASGFLGGVTIPLPYPVAVATSTRVAVRAASSGTTAVPVNLTVVAQADVVAM